MGDAAASSRLDRFLREFWRDVGLGACQPLEAYLAEFPELAADVRAEYAAALAGNEPATTFPSGGEASFDSLPDGATPIPVHRIGRYDVGAQLAKGGQGRILLGWDRELQRRIVLKTLKGQALADRDATLERLQREARIGSRLYHDGICPVLDVVHDGDELFVVMPYIEGVNLHDLIRRAREVARTTIPAAGTANILWQVYDQLCSEHGQSSADPSGAESSQETAALSASLRAGDLRPVVRLVESIADALAAAHEHGIVHRDLKPSNVVLRPGFVPTVLDFGLALDLNDDQVARLTVPGEVLGTPAYMAPEQLDADGPGVSARTDVYALGVLLYEVLTLERPYREKSMSALANRITKGSPRSPRSLNPAIPASLEAVCLKAMDVDPERRYASMAEFAADLRRVRMLQPTVATPPSTAERFFRVVKRNPVAALGIGLAAVLAVLAVHQWTVDRHRRYILDLCREHQANPGSLTVAERSELCRALHLESWQLEDLARQPQRAFEVFIAFLLDTTRAAGVVTALRPTHAIVANPPTFRFRVGPGATGGFRIHLDGQVFEVDSRPDERGFVSFTPGQRLAVGRHRWFVSAGDERSPADQPLVFRVAAPAELAELRAALPRTGDVVLDRYVELTGLLRAGFGEVALAVLDGLPPADRSRLPHRGRFLRMWAYALSNRRKEYVEQQVELLTTPR